MDKREAILAELLIAIERKADILHVEAANLLQNQRTKHCCGEIMTLAEEAKHPKTNYCYLLSGISL